MKKSLILCTLLSAALCLGVNAQEATYTPGVTVMEDAASATGYTVTFVYDAPEAEQVQLRGAFLFYFDEEDVRGTTPEVGATPEEWENGMFEAGDEALTVDMVKDEATGYWVTSMPLPSGHYQYVFLVDGDADTKLEDPTNPMEASGVENGNHYDRSTFYVPYDAEKQSESIDFSFMAPREDGNVGTLSYVNYTDINGNPAPLGVYLPAGYTEDAQPYKVLYISHGGGGNETDWFAGGSLDYIFDNLIADGVIEPFVIIAMNNSAYSWQFETIVNNLVGNVIPYAEENYNIATEASGRAFAGLSMGGVSATNVLFRATADFGYVAIMSGADASLDSEEVDYEAMKGVNIMLGAGIYDFGLTGGLPGNSFGFYPLDELTPILDAHEVPYKCETVLGSHDWNTWPLLIKIFAEDYLWK